MLPTYVYSNNYLESLFTMSISALNPWDSEWEVLCGFEECTVWQVFLIQGSTGLTWEASPHGVPRTAVGVAKLHVKFNTIIMNKTWMWELDYKESWVLKHWCFWTVVLEKTLGSPLDCKEIQPVYSFRKSVLNIHWKDWCWSWNSNTLATWCEELTNL